MPTQATLASKRHTQLGTLVRMVEDMLRADGSTPQDDAPVAVVHADWNQIAPVLAALQIYAHAFRHHHDSAWLALARPAAATDEDGTAMAVLLDALDAPAGLPRVRLVTSEEVADTEVPVFEPTNDESDLLALAWFAARIYDVAEQIDHDN